MEVKTELEAIKSFLNGTLERFPDEDEIETILHLAQKALSYRANVGIRAERIKTNAREKAFYEEWLKENEPHGFISNGHGILQDLFIEKSFEPLGTTKILEHISSRDRVIVATVIQWLGSNCGMSFLTSSLDRFNARIVYDK